MIKSWIEAMRFRTLLVSIAGVVAGVGCAILLDSFRVMPALQCLAFAVLAQLASNFGNEYYDFKNGIDKKGRTGFRRGVTEGEIAPESMKRASFLTLTLAAVIGCGTLFFFGIVPVTLTCYLQTGTWECLDIALPTSVAVGLLAANVLVVNNYRDMEDDAAVEKRTTVVIFGRHFMSAAYLLSGILAMAVMILVWHRLIFWSLFVPIVNLSLHFTTWQSMKRAEGTALNPILGRTAVNLLIFSLLYLIAIVADVSMPV